MKKKQAWTTGNSGGQNELIPLRFGADSITLLEPLLDGAVLYHVSMKTKTLFISKTYEYIFQDKKMPIIISIICKSK
jgi:hypothetical protein